MPAPLLIPLITTGASLVGSAFGLSKSAEANRKAESYLSSRINSLDARFNKDYYQDFLDTEAARSTMGRLNSQFTDMAKNIKSSAASGSTAEAEIAAKDNLQKSYADSVSSIAGMGTQYKMGLRSAYDYNRNRLEDKKMGILESKAANWNNFGSNVGKAAEGILTAYGAGAFGNGTGDTSIGPPEFDYSKLK